MLTSWFLIFLSSFFDSLAAFAVKNKFNELGAINFSSFASVGNYLWAFVKSPILILAIIAYGLSPAIWFFALNRIELSVGYPVLVGFHLIFISIFSVFFLKETVSAEKLIGILLIGFSLYLFYRK